MPKTDYSLILHTFSMQISTSTTTKSLRIAVLGCGSRGRTYTSIAATLNGRYEITAAADLVESRTAAVAGFAPAGTVHRFSSAE